MTTTEAFKQMIALPGIGRVIGVHTANVAKYRSTPPSIAKQEELLRKAGWIKEPERWMLNGHPDRQPPP